MKVDEASWIQLQQFLCTLQSVVDLRMMILTEHQTSNIVNVLKCSYRSFSTLSWASLGWPGCVNLP